MSRLVKGMYGHQFNATRDALFGIRCGQMRSPSMVHNGGWYNEKGEKLGWGDLSQDDLVRISEQLLPGEVFIVLPEQASFWEFVTQFGMIGSMCATKPEEQAPGIEYCIQKCSYVVKHKQIYPVSDWDRADSTLPREKVRELINA